MSSPSEINNVASMASSTKTEITNQNTSYLSSTGLSDCRGEIVDAIKAANIRAKSKVTNLTTAYSTLNTKLTNLSNAVRRAESQRAVVKR